MNKQPSFYEISWIDSEAETGWDSPDKIKVSEHLIKSYGFFIKQTKEFYVIASDIDLENNHYNRFIHIPLVNIKRKKKVKL